MPAIALSVWMPAGRATAVAAFVGGAVSWRVVTLAHDRRRARWVTRLLDEPLFVHWGATVVASLLAVPCMAVLGTAAAVLSVESDGLAASACFGSYGLGLVIGAWAVWGRRRFVRVSRVDVEVSGLAAALDGYRIVHLSDLHIGSYDPKDRGMSWVERANALEPDLIAVTGDLVTTGTTFYDDVAEVLGSLRAPGGVFVSLGNHDQWDPDALTRAIESRGVRVLRNRWVSVEAGGAALRVGGLDDWYTGRDDLDRALCAHPDEPTILLSHYPRFFEAAARRGADLVLSGHTHGGQLAVPGLARRLNIAALSERWFAGRYRLGSCTLHVSAGLGTTGPPMRLGVAPEIAVLALRATRERKG